MREEAQTHNIGFGIIGDWRNKSRSSDMFRRACRSIDKRHNNAKTT